MGVSVCVQRATSKTRPSVKDRGRERSGERERRGRVRRVRRAFGLFASAGLLQADWCSEPGEGKRSSGWIRRGFVI